MASSAAAGVRLQLLGTRSDLAVNRPARSPTPRPSGWTRQGGRPDRRAPALQPNDSRRHVVLQRVVRLTVDRSDRNASSSLSCSTASHIAPAVTVGVQTPPRGSVPSPRAPRARPPRFGAPARDVVPHARLRGGEQARAPEQRRHRDPLHEQREQHHTDGHRHNEVAISEAGRERSHLPREYPRVAVALVRV